MERESVILCRNLQKYSAYKIEELVRFEFSNFILWRHKIGFLVMRNTNPKYEEFKTITWEK